MIKAEGTAELAELHTDSKFPFLGATLLGITPNKSMKGGGKKPHAHASGGTTWMKEGVWCLGCSLVYPLYCDLWHFSFLSLPPGFKLLMNARVAMRILLPKRLWGGQIIRT